MFKERSTQPFNRLARTAILAALPFAAATACTDQQQVPQAKSPTEAAGNRQEPQRSYSAETKALLRDYYNDLQAVGKKNDYEGGVLTIYFETGVYPHTPIFLIEQPGRPPVQFDSSEIPARNNNSAVIIPVITADCAPIRVSVQNPDGRFEPLNVVGSKGKVGTIIELDSMDNDTCIGVYTLEGDTLSSINRSDIH